MVIYYLVYILPTVPVRVSRGRVKPRGQMKGRGFIQMTTILNNSHIVKRSTQGEGVKIVQNFVHVGRGLYIPPYINNGHVLVVAMIFSLIY